jgi:glycosyltransferase involved in cell wall biosynthesis
MGNALVSVIVPCYNTERFLPKCLGSLVGQTYRNLEIICFNDASTDGTLKVLQSFAERDERVKVIDSSVNMSVGGVGMLR